MYRNKHTTDNVAVVAALMFAAIGFFSQQAGAQPSYTVPGGVQSLNGTSDCLTNSYELSMAKPSITGKISMSAWVCPNQTDTPQVVFKREGAYQLQVNVSNNPRFYFTVWTSSGIRSLASDICIDTLRWQHIVGTYDGTNWSVYHNGRLVGSKIENAGTPLSGGTAPLWVGANIVGGMPQMFFGGNVSGVAVYDVALTLEQVAALAATPPLTQPPPIGSTTITQVVNDAVISLEVGNGLRLNQFGDSISSGGGRLFVINLNGSPISSDRVVVRQGEITTLNSGWQIPFDLPGNHGSGVLEFLPGNTAGLLQPKLSLTNNGASGEWQVAFPYLEGVSLNGLSPSDVEFFYPFQDGWVGRGRYDIKGGYGNSAWLPVVSAWSTSGPGIAIQGRDTNFNFCIMRLRNTETDETPVARYFNYDNVENKFFITKPGATLARYSLPFTLEMNAVWNAPDTVIQFFVGTNKFKDVLSSYGQWARANWWTHDPTPTSLRDKFLSVSHWENNDGNWWGRDAEYFSDTYHAHPIFEWAFWWDHDETITCNDGRPYMLTLGNYGFESNWGGAPAYAADVARCRASGVSTLLYLQARIVWKQSPVGISHKTDWGYMDSPGHYNEDWSGTTDDGCIGDYWSMCPQATGWHQYLRDACQLALQGSEADGVRLDTASEYLICHNPNHPHTESLDGVTAFLQTVRTGVAAAGADKWMMVEVCGSDAAARYVDGSLAQAHDAGNPLTSQMNGYGIIPFRFVYPEVKLVEWGNMTTETNYHQASRRMVFNGVGTTLGTGNSSHIRELFHFSEVLRGMGDVFASTDCEPLCQTMKAGVVANRFSLNGREVYTLWNQSGAQVSGQMLRISGGSGRRFMDMIGGRTISPTRDGNDDIVALTIPNDEVVMIGVFPGKIIQTTRESFSQTFYLQNAQELSLQAVDATTDEVLVSGGSLITVNDSLLSGRTVVVRAVKDGYLVHDCIEVAPVIENEYAPDANTVVLWHLNEGSGTTAADAATPVLDGPNNGTLATGSTIWTNAGKFGKGLVSLANNTTGYVGTSLGAGLFTGQQFTMDAWIKPTAIAPSGSYIMGLDDNAGGNAGAFVRLNVDANTITFAVYNMIAGHGHSQTDLEASLGSGVDVLDGKWRHVACTYSNQTLRVYVNGVEVGSAATAGYFTLAQPVRFNAAGATPWNPDQTDGHRYMGYVDEIRLSNKARSDYSAMPPSPPPTTENSPDNRTVVLWHLNEGSGSTAVDVATPVLDGSNNGAIATGSTVWTNSGKFGSGLVSTANNITGYVGTSLGSGLFTGQQFTMDAWVKPTAIAPSGSYVMGLDDNAGGNAGAFVRLDNANTIMFAVYNVISGYGYTQSNLEVSLGGGVNLLDGNWHHISCTYNNQTLKVYVNGVQVGSTTTASYFTLAQPVRFNAAGSTPWNPNRTDGYRYLGGIDEIRLSNIARTDFTEVPAPPQPTAENSPDTRTVVLWHLNEASGTTVADVATPLLDGSNNGTIVLDDTWTTGRFGSGLNAPLSGTGYVFTSLSMGLFSTRAAMDAWIKPTAIEGGAAYVMGWSGSGTQYSFIRLYNGNNIGVGFRVTNGGIENWAESDFGLGAVNLLAGDWYHIAGSYSNGVVRFYLNGTLVGSHNTGYGAGWTLMQPNTFYAAGGPPWDMAGSGGSRYIGAIDEVRLSNIARSDFSTVTLTPAVSIVRKGNSVIVTYTGVLQSALAVTGPYEDVDGVASPYTTTASDTQRYFRTREP